MIRRAPLPAPPSRIVSHGLTAIAGALRDVGDVSPKPLVAIWDKQVPWNEQSASGSLCHGPCDKTDRVESS